MDPFANHQYINLETFRKNGLGVKTPVWFVYNEGVYYVWTQADSGKAKRIRRDGNIRVVPSTASGEPRGAWIAAQATTNASPQAIEHVYGLMRKKYGLAFLAFQLVGKMRKSRFTTLRIELRD